MYSDYIVRINHNYYSFVLFCLTEVIKFRKTFLWVKIIRKKPISKFLLFMFLNINIISIMLSIFCDIIFLNLDSGFQVFYASAKSCITRRVTTDNQNDQTDCNS